MKVKGLALKIVSLVATVLTFIGLALKFAYQKFVYAGISEIAKAGLAQMGVKLPESESLSVKDWVDSFDSLKAQNVDGLGWFKTARVFMIIALVIIAIVAVITIVQFFFNHKVLSLAKLCASVLGLVSVVVFLITLITGSVVIANSLTDVINTSLAVIPGASVTISFLPHVGAYFIALFGIASLVPALIDRKAN